MIYFIQAGANGPIKIGFSSNVAARFVGLQIANHEKLVLLGAKDGSYIDERRLHNELKAYRVRGEWFYASDAVLMAAKDLEHTATSLTAACPTTGYDTPTYSGVAAGKIDAIQQVRVRAIGYGMCIKEVCAHAGISPVVWSRAKRRGKVSIETLSKMECALDAIEAERGA